MKHIFTYCIAIAVLASTSLLNGCKDGSSSETKADDPKELAEKYNKAKATEKKESQFMVDAADICLTVLELCKNTQQNAANAEIKNIARNLETDHSKMLEEIKKMASEKMITVPTGLSKRGSETNEKLMARSGDEFDKQFCETMVEEHKDAVEKYKKATEDVEDIDIKNWANAQLPMLRNHLDLAMTCNEKFKNNESLDDISKSKKPDEKAPQKTPEKSADDGEKKDDGTFKKDKKKKDKKKEEDAEGK